MTTPLYLLLNTAHRAMRRYTASNTAISLASLRAEVLLFLEASRSVGFSEVARTLKVTAPRLSELIGRMVDDGLVTRFSEPKDGRAQRLSLTDKGHVARQAALNASFDLDAIMTESFTDEEVAVVARWIETVQVRCDAANERRRADQTALPAQLQQAITTGRSHIRAGTSSG